MNIVVQLPSWCRGVCCPQRFFVLRLRLLTFWRTTATVVEKFPRKRTRKQMLHIETWAATQLEPRQKKRESTGEQRRAPWYGDTRTSRTVVSWIKPEDLKNPADAPKMRDCNLQQHLLCLWIVCNEQLVLEKVVKAQHFDALMRRFFTLIHIKEHH